MKKSLFKILAETDDLSAQGVTQHGERCGRHDYDDAESGMRPKRFKHSLRDLRGGRHSEKNVNDEIQLVSEAEYFWRERNAA